MTKLTMPEPAAWLVKSASFQTPILQAHKPTMVLSDETITPLYTAEALCDVCKWWLFHPSRRPAFVVNPRYFHQSATFSHSQKQKATRAQSTRG